MKCKHCGKEIEDGSLFCGYCGKEQPKVKNCIKCGQEIDADAGFCGYCGAKQSVEETVHELVHEDVVKPVENLQQEELNNEQVVETFNTEKVAESTSLEPLQQKETLHEEMPVEIKTENVTNEISSIESEVTEPSEAESAFNKNLIYAVIALVVIIGIGIFAYSKFHGGTDSAVGLNDSDSVQVIDANKLVTDNVPVPSKPTGEQVSECPNDGIYFIVQMGVKDSDSGIDIYGMNLQYYVSNNAVQAWNGNDICAEYTYAPPTNPSEFDPNDGLQILSFKIYSKLLPKLNSEPNRIYCTFSGKSHHKAGPADGIDIIDNGIIKTYGAKNGKIYISLIEDCQGNDNKSISDTKSYDVDGSLLSHTKVESLSGTGNRNIKTEYYDKQDNLDYYTVEETIDSSNDEFGNVKETVKTTKYDKNGNVISTETHDESYGID